MRYQLQILFLASLIGFNGHSAHAQPFDFALIGDMPYAAIEQNMAITLAKEIQSDHSLAWVVHVGDMRGGGHGDCSDGEFERRQKLFRYMSQLFILTPGDNDWYDCDESGFDPVERLQSLRKRFYSSPGRVVGKGSFIGLSQASENAYPAFIENILWWRDEVLFATVHLIQPGFKPFQDKRSKAAYQQMLAAAENWLLRIFEEARRGEAKAVFIATQADLWPVTGLPKMLRILAPGHDQTRGKLGRFARQLKQQVRHFGKPVVVANGDTHYFRVDKPLHDSALRPLENFTRVETFGSPFMHWIRVTVDTQRPEVFSFREEWIEENFITVNRPGKPASAPPAGFDYEVVVWLGELMRWQPLFALLGLLVTISVIIRWLWRLRP